MWHIHLRHHASQYNHSNQLVLRTKTFKNMISNESEGAILRNEKYQ